MINKSFFKSCPSCSAQMSYTESWKYKQSIRTNKLCRKCAQTKDNMYSNSDEMFLKNNYSILGAKECSKILNRSSQSVSIKARKLNLKFRDFGENRKFCCKCKEIKDKNMFGLDRNRKDFLVPTCKECIKKYREEHKTDKTIYDRLYVRERLKTDVRFKITRKLRNNLKTCLKNKGIRKKNKTIDLIGCSVEFLIKYMENKFKDGMSWNNHGSKGWHIDHIIPCSFFNLENVEEQKKCFHYSNLQPLWWYENLSKSNKLL